MTLWQFDLLIGGDFLLLAAVAFLGARRLQARGYGSTSRSILRLPVLMSAFLFSGALVSWWSDSTSAKRARQRGETWHPFLLPTVMVNSAFLLLALTLVYLLVEVVLFVRRRRRASRTATAAE
jgi:hypothetical protein